MVLDDMRIGQLASEHLLDWLRRELTRLPLPIAIMAQSDHRAFRQHVGRTVGEEIDRQRVEHAKKLLLETRHKLHVIARLSGFSGAEHFTRTFRRVTGAPPSAYRRRLRSGGEAP